MNLPHRNGAPDPQALTKHLEKIRVASNVVQALENLLVQCADDPECAVLVIVASEELSRHRHRMKWLIHQLPENEKSQEHQD